jgi:hypothetical protein
MIYVVYTYCTSNFLPNAKRMKHLYLLIPTLLISISQLLAQESGFQPDITRAYFHYQLDLAQKNLLAKDGKADSVISIDPDPAVNQTLTFNTLERFDSLQKQIEFSKSLAGNQKVAALKGAADLLNHFGKLLATGKMRWAQLPPLAACFDDAMQANLKGTPLLAAVQQYKYPIAALIANSAAFADNSSLQPLREWVLFKTIEDRPELLLKELSKNANYPFTDSLLSVAARQMPEELFTYAQARNTVLGKKLTQLSESDSLVKIITRLSRQSTGQMFLPFLDLMHEGKLTWDEVGAAVRDPDKYYQLLVKTNLTMLANIAAGGTATGTKGLTNMLKQKSYELYVNVINGLHDAPAGVRFRKIQKLAPEELYYLIVLNEETIYTSSYLYVYNRIFGTMKSRSADSLMQLVHFDKYKKFITMASNYNTLNDFLAKMNPENANALMTNFVSGLENGKSKDDIEDAVDVANAYASITQPTLRQLMRAQIAKNREHSLASGNKKGNEIYRIEQLIMESSDSASTVNLTDSLGIPPVFEVKNKSMQDSLGRVIMQMFFHDDGTGKGEFNVLSRLYSNRKKWALTSNKYWVQFTSIGTPVPFILFVNRPLDSNKDLDALAQRETVAYMQDNGFDPSITVHRGHSFSLKYTIEKLQATSKVVVLGSCGAYQNLSDILKICPDSYIISSKQVGIGEINTALFQYLMEHLKMGQDIKWPVMMEEIRKHVVRKGGYDDYVFPHRNLGALFIKAYKIAEEKQGLASL